MRSVLVVLVVCILLAACGGSEPASPIKTSAPPTKAWYDGGTLHNATAAEWKAATDANRLATSADWATVMTGWDTLTVARVLATDLRLCVNEAVKASPAQQKVNELAAACAVLMGWESK